MTIREALQKSIKELKENNIQEPVLKARILLAFVIGKDKEYLVTHENENVGCGAKGDQKEMDFEQSVNRLIQGEPLQHITGVQEFMKLKFVVNKDVLIPRSDTEILAEEVIKILQKNVGVAQWATRPAKPAQILDLCTGSGAIAISIAKYVENATVLGTDISQNALNIAEQNAINNNVKIQFFQSDLFVNVKGKFDLIVSNPPYIEREKIKKLDMEVQNEPRAALDGGEDGLDFYRKTIAEAYKYLKPEGYLCLEIGYNQKESVIQLIEESNHYRNIYSKKDLANNDRVVICRFHQK